MAVNEIFVIAPFVLFGSFSAALAFKPRLLPRMTNAYYAFIHIKTRVDEDDYDNRVIRVVGTFFLFGAIYILSKKFLTH